MAKICLNMIVRNERERISRCLKSLVPYIDYYCIIDTGSTDGTQQEIATFFDIYGVPGEIHNEPFKNFEQARNIALAYARNSTADYDWILLCDADMEIVVEDKNFRDKLHGLCMNVIQKAGSLSYHNARFLHRLATGKYRGVTHEYLDVPASGLLEGVWFIDHADGSNRKEKYLRDIQLLLDGLHEEPDNSRYFFYLAQSYRDAGKPADAEYWYEKRANAGGWEEEAWNARYNVAHCRKDIGDGHGFVSGLLEAWNSRPSRAEPLYDLARYYREHGRNTLAAAFAGIGMQIPYTKDMLFVNEYAYKTGFREEFSIAAFYDEGTRAEGFKVCDGLAIRNSTPEPARSLARDNLYHYILPLRAYCSTFEAVKFDFPADGYTLMNPSIARHGDQLWCVVRSVNYTITSEGRYAIKSGDGSINDSNPIHTRNYLARLNDNLAIEVAKEIAMPEHFPDPEYKLVRGFEDMRLISWRGSLWTSACVREFRADGYCEQVLAHIDEAGHGYRLNMWHRMLPPVRTYEKNWMPFVHKGELQFMYRTNTVVDIDGQTVRKTPLNHLAVEHLSGGGQLLPWQGGWLGIVHEARAKPDGQRYYQHRFMHWTEDNRPVAVSRPFCFFDRQIEFAAGLAFHPETPGQLLISYGVRDCEAWIASVDTSDVWDMLYGQD